MSAHMPAVRHACICMRLIFGHVSTSMWRIFGHMSTSIWHICLPMSTHMSAHIVKHTCCTCTCLSCVHRCLCHTHTVGYVCTHGHTGVHASCDTHMRTHACNYVFTHGRCTCQAKVICTAHTSMHHRQSIADARLTRLRTFSGQGDGLQVHVKQLRLASRAVNIRVLEGVPAWHVQGYGHGRL